MIDRTTPRSLLATAGLGLLLLVLFLGVPVAADAEVLKIATLAPEGSVWDQAYRAMGQEWAEGTNGAVQMRIYAGGVAGDEPDTVRKMRIGQLHGAVLTVAGLQVIDPGFSVFEIPLFFDSYDELEHVLDALRDEFAGRLETEGYVMLGWSQAGWVHLFSTQPVASVDDLKKLKLYSWSGDPATTAMWRKNGYQPVAVSSTDILTSLQTGMIDAVPTTPLAAASLQWFRQTPYMHGLGFAPLVGATVLSRRAWNKLDAAERKVLLDAGRAAEDRLFEQVPARDRESVEEMKKRGLQVTAVSEADDAGWRAAAKTFADFRRGQLEDKGLLDRVRAVRDAYRASLSGTGRSGGNGG